MRHQVESQLLPRRLRHRNHILDTDSFLHLSADTVGHNSHRQTFTGSIDSCRTSGRTSADDDNIVVLFYHRQVLLFHAILRFELAKQFAKVSTTYMDQFTVGKYGRYSLHFHGSNLFLVDRTVHHFVRDFRVQRSHGIQSLYNVWTVGTGQRNICSQFDWTIQGLHTVTNTFVGNIFAFAVAVQDSQQQRSKFVSVGNAPEFNTGFFPVFQQRELQAFAVCHLYGDLIGTGSHIVQQFQ